MFALAPNVRIFIACGVTDMRKGFDGLVGRIEQDLKADPYGGAFYIFRGKRGDIVKALHWDGQGLVLYAKRLEKGRFTWPQAKDGVMTLTSAQLAIFPNRTHLIPYDDPEQFNGTVDRFLATPFKKIDLIPQTMGSFEKMMTGLAH